MYGTYFFIEDGGYNRSPEEAPYAFSPYWTWYKKKPESIEWEDRIREWNGEKYKEAMEGLKKLNSFDAHPSIAEAQIFIDRYFDEKYTVVALGRGCNVSSGYPMLIFGLDKKEKTDA